LTWRERDLTVGAEEDILGRKDVCMYAATQQPARCADHTSIFVTGQIIAQKSRFFSA